MSFISFFFNDTATTEIYTLSLHDALPIYRLRDAVRRSRKFVFLVTPNSASSKWIPWELGLGDGALHSRSEEHTSELQSRLHLVCRLLLEKKKRITQGMIQGVIAGCPVGLA